MKRTLLPGLMTVVIALSLSAFANLPQKRITGYYWFPLDATGQPQAVTTLVYLPYDPYQCSTWAPGGYCAAAYTSYSGTHAPYYASGSQMQVDYKMYH